LIYNLAKPYFIPHWVHRASLLLLCLLGYPRRLGLPEGFWLVICPVESLWGFGGRLKAYH
jgi:hypothetical protein